MDEVEVRGEAEVALGGVEVAQRLVVGHDRVAPDLAGDPQLALRRCPWTQTGLPDGVAQLALVPVERRAVDEPVADVDAVGDDASGVGRLDLVQAEADQRERRAVVEDGGAGSVGKHAASLPAAHAQRQGESRRNEVDRSRGHPGRMVGDVRRPPPTP